MPGHGNKKKTNRTKGNVKVCIVQTFSCSNLQPWDRMSRINYNDNRIPVGVVVNL